MRLLSTTKPESFEAAVAELPAARELSFLTGRFDYQLRAACVDADDLDHTVRALRQLPAPPSPRRESCCARRRIGARCGREVGRPEVVGKGSLPGGWRY